MCWDGTAMTSLNEWWPELIHHVGRQGKERPSEGTKKWKIEGLVMNGCDNVEGVQNDGQVSGFSSLCGDGTLTKMAGCLAQFLPDYL